MQRDRAMREGSSGSDSDGAIDGEEIEDGDGESEGLELPVAADLVASHGAFVPPVGYKVLAAPSTVTYEKMHTAIPWSNKKIAHIFDNGWIVGTFRGKRKVRTTSPEWEVYYADDRRVWKHSLDLAEYGCEGTWVIIEKLPVKAPRRSKRSCN